MHIYKQSVIQMLEINHKSNVIENAKKKMVVKCLVTDSKIKYTIIPSIVTFLNYAIFSFFLN